MTINIPTGPVRKDTSQEELAELFHYYENTGRDRIREGRGELWQAGNILLHARNVIPAGRFSEWLDASYIKRTTAYDYLLLREHFTLEEAKSLSSMREAKQLVAENKDDPLSVQRAEQPTPPSLTETEELRKVNETEPESEFWSGFNEDDPAVADPEPDPEPQPLPADEVVWEDPQEEAAVLEPEEKREKLSYTDKLELRLDELDKQNTELREANSDLALDNADLQGQIRNLLNEDKHDNFRHTEVVRLQARVSILNGQCHDTSVKLNDAKGELRKSKSTVKGLMKERDGLRHRLGIAT